MMCLYIDTICLHIDTIVDEYWLNGKGSINSPSHGRFHWLPCYQWKRLFLPFHWGIEGWVTFTGITFVYYPDWSQRQQIFAVQPAFSGCLGESETVSSSSHVGNRRAAKRSRPDVRAIPISLFSPAVEGAVRGAPRAQQGVFSPRDSFWAPFSLHPWHSLTIQLAEAG